MYGLSEDDNVGKDYGASIASFYFKNVFLEVVMMFYHILFDDHKISTIDIYE